MNIHTPFQTFSASQNAANANPVQVLGSQWMQFFPSDPVPSSPTARLQITKSSRYMITRPRDAEEMSVQILKFCDRMHLGNASAFRVTDATAGCGGNSINLLKHFAHVTAVERDPVHFAVLKNNLSVYGFHEGERLKLINADYTHIFDNLVQDIVILDCPWMNDATSTWYSRCKQLNLYLSDKPIATLVDELFRRSATRVIVVKSPQNFDLQTFVKQVTACRNLYMKICSIHSYKCLIMLPEP